MCVGGCSSVTIWDLSLCERSGLPCCLIVIRVMDIDSTLHCPWVGCLAPNPDIAIGQATKCVKCTKPFVQIACPTCTCLLVWPGVLVDGQQELECSACDTVFLSLLCPYQGCSAAHSIDVELYRVSIKLPSFDPMGLCRVGCCTPVSRAEGLGCRSVSIPSIQCDRFCVMIAALPVVRHLAVVVWQHRGPTGRLLLFLACRHVLFLLHAVVALSDSMLELQV